MNAIISSFGIFIGFDDAGSWATRLHWELRNLVFGSRSFYNSYVESLIEVRESYFTLRFYISISWSSAGLANQSEC